MRKILLSLNVIIILFFSQAFGIEKIPDVKGSTWKIESDEPLLWGSKKFFRGVYSSDKYGSTNYTHKYYESIALYDFKITFNNYGLCTLSKKYKAQVFQCPYLHKLKSERGIDLCYGTGKKIASVQSSIIDNQIFIENEYTCTWSQKGNKIKWDWIDSLYEYDGEKNRRYYSGILNNNQLTGNRDFENEVTPIVGYGINVKKWKEVLQDSSGTGFFISTSGHIATNNHVVDKCKTINITYNNKKEPAKILARDNVNDIAVLKTDIEPKDMFYIASEDIDKLEEIYVAGFPYGKDISESIKITKGIVSSNTGIGNNLSNMQIDAALQPGNSGGPIINSSGEVVGVAVAKLDFERIYEMYGDLPENTNFGIKSSTLKSFLKVHDIDVPSSSFISGLLNMFNSSESIVRDKVDNAVVYIECKNK